jgi:hypothetical protein
MEKLTFTEAEFCKVVGISRTTAWNLRRKGRLQHCRVGAKILYTQQHIENFVSTHQRPLHELKRASQKIRT